MITAAKSSLFARLFAFHTERRLKSAFHSFRVSGLAAVRTHLSSSPVLVVSNHTSWWDPIVILHLCERVLHADAFAMMDAKNLRSLSFFRKVGAFGVDLDDPADGARSIRYAAKLLDRAGRLVWIFPQGREVPVTQRPLGFRGGSAEIARIAKKATLLPVAIRYEFGNQPKPSVFVAFGETLDVVRDVSLGRQEQEDAVTRALESIDTALITNETTAFEFLFREKRNFIFDWASKVLAWATRPRVH